MPVTIEYVLSSQEVRRLQVAVQRETVHVHIRSQKGRSATEAPSWHVLIVIVSLQNRNNLPNGFFVLVMVS